jgi:hypothetical protein
MIIDDHIIIRTGYCSGSTVPLATGAARQGQKGVAYRGEYRRDSGGIKKKNGGQHPVDSPLPLRRPKKKR